MSRVDYKDFKGESKESYMFIIRTILNKGSVAHKWMRHKPKFYALEDKYKSLIFRCVIPDDYERDALTNWRKFYERR